MKFSQVKRLVNSNVDFEIFQYGNIFHFHFKTTQDLASTFVRFQEFYESPHFKDKTFSLWNFYQYYKKFKKGKFSYFTDWTGFNLPSRVFTQIDIKSMTTRESLLLSKLPKSGKFYVIGTCGKKDNVYREILLHEKAHAFFNLSKEYKNKSLKLIKTKDFSLLRGYLKSLGYNQSVFNDEIQAYLLSDFKYLAKDKLLDNSYKELQLKLISLFEKEDSKIK